MIQYQGYEKQIQEKNLPIKCPECDSNSIIFYREFAELRIWTQDNGNIPHYEDFERGYDSEENLDQWITFRCLSCGHEWDGETSIVDFLLVGPPDTQ